MAITKSSVLERTDNFPIKHKGPVYIGKVRSVYWLPVDISQMINEYMNYKLVYGTQLGVMIISDKISAFECNWVGERGVGGIPGKGASLNGISRYWFEKFDKAGLAGNHILDVPHPLVWIVQKAQPIMIEAIARQYITGSMWRAYNEGVREFCGIKLPDNLEKNQRLENLLVTPSTKGIIKGIKGIPEEDDVNLTRQQIIDNCQAFGFKLEKDVATYEKLLKEGFNLIANELDMLGEIFVDTKFEFGYVQDKSAKAKIIYIDEIGTPDSSRIWDKNDYVNNGKVVENSKEGFRQFLIKNLDSEILTNKKRMPERVKMAKDYRVPLEQIQKISDTYMNIAEIITGKQIPIIENAREEITSVLAKYGVLK